MPKINTHLHAAMRLSEKIKVKNLEAFCLGNAYPDCQNLSAEQPYSYNNDFELGCLFHLWLDNHFLRMDMEDISKYDCMICDMQAILPIIQELQKKTFEGKEEQAMKNILSLESEPMPLYLVPDHKKERYIKILDEMIEKFMKESADVIGKN